MSEESLELRSVPSGTIRGCKIICTAYLKDYLSNHATKNEDPGCFQKKSGCMNVPCVQTISFSLLTLWCQLEDMFQLIGTSQGIERVLFQIIVTPEYFEKYRVKYKA